MYKLTLGVLMYGNITRRRGILGVVRGTKKFRLMLYWNILSFKIVWVEDGLEFQRYSIKKEKLLGAPNLAFKIWKKNFKCLQKSNFLGYSLDYCLFCAFILTDWNDDNFLSFLINQSSRIVEEELADFFWCVLLQKAATYVPLNSVQNSYSFCWNMYR